MNKCFALILCICEHCAITCLLNASLITFKMLARDELLKAKKLDRLKVELHVSQFAKCPFKLITAMSYQVWNIK